MPAPTPPARTSVAGRPGTLADVVPATGRWAVGGRRAYLAGLLALVLAGAAGLLGVRSTTVSAEGGGFRLEVTYPRVARAGLDVPFDVVVRRDGGLPDTVVLTLTGDYLALYETQGFTPEPASSTRDAETLRLAFDAPDGDVLRFSYDAYVEPAAQRGRGATVGVEADGDVVASVPLSTWVWP